MNGSGDDHLQSVELETLPAENVEGEQVNTSRLSQSSGSGQRPPPMIDDDQDGDADSVVRVNSSELTKQSSNMYTQPVHNRTGSGLTRKWSVTGVDLTLGEAQARRLEKKGDFSATLDDEAGTVTLNTEDFKKVRSARRVLVPSCSC